MKVLAALVVLAALLVAPTQGLRLPATRPAQGQQGPRRVRTAVGLEAKDGGVPAPGRLRIINGDNYDDMNIPYFALIIMDDVFMCGGSMISETFVLTAGQCVGGYINFLVMMGTSAGYGDDRYQMTNKAIVHEDFQKDTSLNDIGLVQLLFPITYSAAIQPVKLPSSADAAQTFVGETATVSGYGENDLGYDSDFLRYLRQNVMDNGRCKRFFLYRTIYDSLLCGDGEGRVGICTVDVGGPLVLEDADGGWTQIGVAAFESRMGCKLGYPSVYTRLTAHLDWVRNKTGISE